MYSLFGNLFSYLTMWVGGISRSLCLPFFLWALQCVTVWALHNFLNQYFINRYLGCFHFSNIVFNFYTFIGNSKPSHWSPARRASSFHHHSSFPIEQSFFLRSALATPWGLFPQKEEVELSIPDFRSWCPHCRIHTALLPLELQNSWLVWC